MEGQYDLRKGAGAYVSIIATFGSLAVPAIVLFFTRRPANDPLTSVDETLTAGLLLIGFIGSLLGAFAFAALSAERDPTANLAAAAMFAGTCTSVSIVGLLGAFEVLAAVYIPGSAKLFSIITAAGGFFGALFTTFTISDSTMLGPTQPGVRIFWVREQWTAIQSRSAAYAMARRMSVVICIFLGATSAVRLSLPKGDRSQIEISGTTASNLIIGLGIAILFFSAACAIFRTSHAEVPKNQKGLRSYEAFGSVGLIVVYTMALVLFLP